MADRHEHGASQARAAPHRARCMRQLSASLPMNLAHAHGGSYSPRTGWTVQPVFSRLAAFAGPELRRDGWLLGPRPGAVFAAKSRRSEEESMTSQESHALQTFLVQRTQAHLNSKDPGAQAMIDTAVAQQPDAAYLLVQRTLLLEQALQRANSQIAQLQAQRTSVSSGAWDQAWAPTSVGPPQRPASAPPAPTQPQGIQPQQAINTTPGWSGILGNAASTAAGVAGGAFLFQGLEGLFGHHGDGFGDGGERTETTDNVTINDYSGDPGLSGSPHADDAYLDGDGDVSSLDTADDSDDELE